MAIYRHYENKEELLLSLCEETFATMIRLLDEARQKPGTRLEQLRRCVRAVVDFHLSHPNHYKVTFMTEIPPGPVAERKLPSGNMSWTACAPECASVPGKGPGYRR